MAQMPPPSIPTLCRPGVVPDIKKGIPHAPKGCRDFEKGQTQQGAVPGTEGTYKGQFYDPGLYGRGGPEGPSRLAAIWRPHEGQFMRQLPPTAASGRDGSWELFNSCWHHRTSGGRGGLVQNPHTTPHPTPPCVCVLEMMQRILWRMQICMKNN